MNIKSLLATLLVTGCCATIPSTVTIPDGEYCGVDEGTYHTCDHIFSPASRQILDSDWDQFDWINVSAQFIADVKATYEKLCTLVTCDEGVTTAVKKLPTNGKIGIVNENFVDNFRPKVY